MKKILFSCLLALGIGVNAQYDFSQDFEDDLTGWYSFGTGVGSLNTVNFCSSTTSGALTYASTTQSAWFADLLEVGDYLGQSDNGQKINISFNYKKGAGLTGTLYAMYAVLEGNSYSVFTVGNGVSLTAGAVTTCGSVTGTVPAGTFDPEKTYIVGTWLSNTGGTTGTLYIDDVVVKQEIATAVPACTSFTYPTNASTIPSGTVSLTWPVVANAASYNVTIGTTPGGSNVLSTSVIGSLAKLDTSLPANTTFYAKIVPINNVGSAVGCQEITFNTSSTVGHCGPLTTSAPTAVAVIKSVNFSGVTNTSDAAAVGIGSFPPYQDFTTTVTIPVKNNVTTLPLSIIGNANSSTANGWAMTAFIDWNNDGDFDDAGESYFNTSATMIKLAGVANTIPLTGNITIPAGTQLGKKVMRIKYNFTGSTATIPHTALLTACANMVNGQAEDYTLDYQDALAVSDVTKAGISVYPNPFADVLKISDVKGVKSVSVNDISGRQVKTLAPSAELNLSNLKSGLYIVNLQMEDGSVKTFKAIKK